MSRTPRAERKLDSFLNNSVPKVYNPLPSLKKRIFLTILNLVFLHAGTAEGGYAHFWGAEWGSSLPFIRQRTLPPQQPLCSLRPLQLIILDTVADVQVTLSMNQMQTGQMGCLYISNFRIAFSSRAL